MEDITQTIYTMPNTLGGLYNWSPLGVLDSNKQRRNIMEEEIKEIKEAFKVIGKWLENSEYNELEEKVWTNFENMKLFSYKKTVQDFIKEYK